MKIFIDNILYEVYWQHVNNGNEPWEDGKKLKSFTTCHLLVDNGQGMAISATAYTHPKDSFNRKLGMKISFDRVVSRLGEKETRTILWKLFLETVFPKQPTYYYKGKPYKIEKFSKVKTVNGWMDCVIYKSLYPHKEGKTWVRGKEDFFSKFKTGLYDEDLGATILNEKENNFSPNSV